MSAERRIELPDVDPHLGARVAFVSLPRQDVLYFKVLLESYEGVAAYRTQEPHHAPGRALVAVLVAPDFAAAAVRILAEARDTVGAEIRAGSRAELAALYAALAESDVLDGR
jgi:hypothetical protein